MNTLHLGFLIFNIVVLIAASIYFLRRPIRSFLVNRAKSLRNKKYTSTTALSEAEKTYIENHDKLKNIKQKVESLIAEAEKDGEKEGRKLLKEAEGVAEKIMKQSMARADNEVRRKNKEFYAEVVEKSVAEAESHIQNIISNDIQIKLGRDFLKRFGFRQRLNG